MAIVLVLRVVVNFLQAPKKIKRKWKKTYHRNHRIWKIDKFAESIKLRYLSNLRAFNPSNCERVDRICFLGSTCFACQLLSKQYFDSTNLEHSWCWRLWKLPQIFINFQWILTFVTLAIKNRIISETVDRCKSTYLLFSKNTKKSLESCKQY